MAKPRRIRAQRSSWGSDLRAVFRRGDKVHFRNAAQRFYDDATFAVERRQPGRFERPAVGGGAGFPVRGSGPWRPKGARAPLQERDGHESHQASFAHAAPDVESERSFAAP